MPLWAVLVKDEDGRGALGQQCVLSGLNGGGLCGEALGLTNPEPMSLGAQVGLGASWHF